MVFDNTGHCLGAAQRDFTQYFTTEGWVEHDAQEILAVQIDCIKTAVTTAGIKGSEVACVGITNQRDTCLIWNKETGKPVRPAITWQCRPSADDHELSQHADLFRRKTGLITSGHFAGPKAKWLLDLAPDSRKLSSINNLAFGTIDSWLIWHLTKEKNHLTEPSNASQTMMCDIQTLNWDEELLKLSQIPHNILPRIVDSNSFFGMTDENLIGFAAPILAVLGDQQAALFGHGCLQEGMAKCTYGTGGFLSKNIGHEMKLAPGLQTAVAWKLTNQETVYALEGVIFVAGAAIQWLRDGLGIISSSQESEELALSIKSNDGVYFIPALAGLGSPWWNQDVRGTIVGLTRGTSRAHLVRAALEAMAYQVVDLATNFDNDGAKLLELRVDGGATKNEFMLQFQSDLLAVPVIRSVQVEATAWGVAALAGIKAGLIDATRDVFGHDLTIYPKNNRDSDYAGWQRALKAAFATSTGCTSKESSLEI